MDLGLTGKVAVVLGATRGIGRATVRRLAGEGAHVVACSRGGADDVAEEARAAGAASALTLTADLTEPGGAEDLVAAIQEAHGRLDVLVNTVGLFERADSAVAADEVWERSYQSVLMTSVRACRAAVPLMLRSGGGALVTTSAMSMRHFTPTIAHYSAQKAALGHFTKNIAREFAAQGIRANAVLPGMIVNESLAARRQVWMTRTGGSEADFFTYVKERYGEVTWGTRLGSPEDVADAILFLASERAAYVSGVLLNVDGGSSYL